VVSDPGVSPDQQISALYAEADRTMAQLKNKVAGIRAARDQAMQVTGEASAQDGSVRARVDSTGVVTALTLAPTVFERSTPEKLAQTVVATLQSAAAQAREKMSAAMVPNAPEEGMSAQAAEGLAAFGIPKFGVPEVPRTAVDPTATDTWGDQPQPDNSAAQQAWATGHAVDPEPAPVAEPAPPAEPVRARVAARPAGRDVDEADFERPW
jgi:DNA-binding protein YbaB